MSPKPMYDDSKWINPQNLLQFCNTNEAFPEAQCDAYIEKLRARGLTVEYLPQPGLKHGEFFPEIRDRLHQFLLEHASAM